MGTQTMGRVLVEIDVANVYDLEAARRGDIAESEVRRVHIPDALVDTGATLVGLPPDVIETLGLTFDRERKAVTGNGVATFRVFSAARLEIMGRDMVGNVVEMPAGAPTIVGYIALEALDFVVDPQAGRIIPNPAHDGKWIIDLL